MVICTVHLPLLLALPVPIDEPSENTSIDALASDVPVTVGFETFTEAIVMSGAVTVVSAAATLLCGVSDTSPPRSDTPLISSTVGVALADSVGETVRVT